jgi:hypothetical protein
MRHVRFTSIHSAFGDYWLKEGMPPLKGRIDPDLKPAIIEVVREALKNKGDQSRLI